MNDQVLVKARITDALVGVHFERTEGHSEMVVIDKFLALEVQLSHEIAYLLVWLPFAA
ncbi:hypothetical protein OCH7691_04582 [Oceanibacterium hippocampi]|uniref:Uncharacterized protein n=1 Tax=Oceanibacterium hippocampi TaxID=745714 RepID=A0A1Y5U061_9PROT|nr:hypothetical protein OCH7691_04582 [Oceanibacterium hippocampi]